MTAGGVKAAQKNPVRICSSAGPVVVDYSTMIAKGGSVASSSAIDTYLSGAKQLLLSSAEAWCGDWVLQLLIVRLVAEVELYVRAVLSGLVGVCPEALYAARTKTLSLASVDYYAAHERALALIEHAALSGSAEVVKATLGLAGLDANRSASTMAALEQFGRVCQLRHAIVHQTGRLGANNVIALNVTGGLALGASVVAVDQSGFQDLVAVCHATVRTYNQFVFEGTCDRWIKSGYLTLKWSQDSARFADLCRLLLSSSDLPAATPQTLHTALGGT